MEYKIPITYINGQIKRAVLDVSLSDEEIKEYNNLNSDNEKIIYLEEKGKVRVIDFRINDWELDINNYKKL